MITKQLKKMTGNFNLSIGDEVTMNSPFMLGSDMTYLYDSLGAQVFKIQKISEYKGKIHVEVANDLIINMGVYTFYDNELDKIEI